MSAPTAKKHGQFASPDTKPGTSIEFDTSPTATHRWSQGVVIGPNAKNTACLDVRDDVGRTWVTHWCNTRLLTALTFAFALTACLRASVALGQEAPTKSRHHGRPDAPVAAAAVAAAKSRTVAKDRSGRTLYTAVPNGSGRTVVKDRSGRTLYSMTLDASGKTVYRDRSGRTLQVANSR